MPKRKKLTIISRNHSWQMAFSIHFHALRISIKKKDPEVIKILNNLESEALRLAEHVDNLQK